MREKGHISLPEEFQIIDVEGTKDIETTTKIAQHKL